MKRLIYGLTVVSLCSSLAFAQDEFDDIYYNPSKSKKLTTSGKKSNSDSQSYYISDFSGMDVDEYNRRGFYYETPIDTIGARVESEEDFVYTQQIQKYYNPTIVTDNADILSDILENAYGNVNIVIENNQPYFSPYYGDYSWYPGLYNWSMRPSAWVWNYAWGPFSWTYTPTWAWSPTWTWSWGWGPAWSYYPWNYPYYPHSHRPYYGHYNRPGATRPVVAGSGWSGAHGNGRPGVGSNVRPGRPIATRPSGNRISGNTGRTPGRVVGSAVSNKANATHVTPNRGINVDKKATSTSRNNRVTSAGKASTSTSTSRTQNSGYYEYNGFSTSGSSIFNNGRSTTSNRTSTSTTTYNRSSSNSSGGSRSYSSGSGSRSTGSSAGRSSGGNHGGGRGGRR